MHWPNCLSAAKVRLTQLRPARDLRRDMDRRRPLGFEQLENRRLLSTVTWTGMGDGTSWADANNWSGDALPGPSDDVVINASAGTTIFIHPSETDSVNSLTSHAPILDEGQQAIDRIGEFVREHTTRSVRT